MYYLKKIILLILLIASTKAQYDPLDFWWGKKPTAYTIIAPEVDTVPLISPFPNTGYAYFDGTTKGRSFWKNGADANARPLELNYSTTDTFRWSLTFIPKRTTAYIIAGKFSSGSTLGYLMRFDKNSSGAKDFSFGITDNDTTKLVQYTVCYINDTINIHHVVIAYGKTNGDKFYFYHGDGTNPDTLVSTQDALPWGSTFHTISNYAYTLLTSTKVNSDCSGLQYPTTFAAQFFKGFVAEHTFMANDTTYELDLRNWYYHQPYSLRDYHNYDRGQTAGSIHFMNGETYSFSRNDVLWVGDTTRIYPMLWNRTLFRPGLQLKYPVGNDSSLCDNFANSKGMVITRHGKPMLIVNGNFNCANFVGPDSSQWDGRLYDNISNDIAVWDVDSNEYESVGTGFYGGSISRGNDTLTIDGVRYLINCGHYTNVFNLDLTTVGDTVGNVCKIAIDTGTVGLPMGQKGFSTQMFCVRNLEDTIYVGGASTIAYNSSGSLTINYIAQYDAGNNSWKALTDVTVGTNGAVYDIERYNGGIIIAGNFTNRGQKITFWNHKTFSAAFETNNPFSSGVIYDVHVDDYGNIWAGGTFPGGIAKWNGSAWSQPITVTGLTGHVTEICSYKHALFFTGSFTRVNNKFMKVIGCYNIMINEPPINIGTINMRGESILPYLYPNSLLDVSNPQYSATDSLYLVYMGDGTIIESDALLIGNVAGLNIRTKLGIY